MASSGTFLGVAVGTGLASVVVATILAVYYYTLKHREKCEPGVNDELFVEPRRCSSLSMASRTATWQDVEAGLREDHPRNTDNRRIRSSDDDDNDDCRSSSPDRSTTRPNSPSNVVVLLLDRWRNKSQRRANRYAVHHRPSSSEFNALAKEQHHAVQPSSAIDTMMMSESGDADYATGTSLAQPRMAAASGLAQSGQGCRSLTRNASISSQGSSEAGGSPSGVASIHRGSSSPRIRAFGPDGRHRQPDSFPTASSYPPSRSSRSPSPARAISLDARCASPAGFAGSGSGTASPSQTSLSSLATGGASSSCGSSSIGPLRSVARCLSPLLIPPPTSSLTSEAAGPAPPASPLGALQPDLYQRQDGPLFLSAQSTTTGKSMGRLHLRLKYDFDRSDLRVHLIEAHDLAGSDQGGFNDPYVKLTLTPEVDTRKRQTPIHRNNPNPFFDQHFKFPVSHEQLQEKTLLLQVFDYDRFSRNDVVGSVRVAMGELEFVSSTSSIEVWGEIAREKKPPEEIQQVLLSLSYLPSAERLTVLILKARNLFPSQPDKEILDPFVKVSLLTGDKRVKKKKTAVRKATRCPVWNEAMSFNVSAGLLAASAIEVCVLDSSSELIGGNAILGSCIVGPATGGGALETEAGVSNQSREHWLHMTHSPRKAIAMWHTLH